MRSSHCGFRESVGTLIAVDTHMRRNVHEVHFQVFTFVLFEYECGSMSEISAILLVESLRIMKRTRFEPPKKNNWLADESSQPQWGLIYDYLSGL